MNDQNIPEMALLLESMNGAYTTESIVTNSVNDYDMNDEENSTKIDVNNYLFED
ncbi:hypothetical protein [Cytobacillus massiliigabonensis]|uniref:hypothetical protein n=1 Tax=Cytobacillus massiliigabonensis TaxID=1871011 RepID=UPI0015E0D20A|nr:hypothetical protein [Cytobacillus massiliigabonensis]